MATNSTADLTSAQQAQQGNRNPDGTYREVPLAEASADCLIRNSSQRRDDQLDLAVAAASTLNHAALLDAAHEAGELAEDDDDDSQRCDQCGERMTVDIGTGVSQHIAANGNTDHDADGDHVAYAAENDSPAPADLDATDWSAPTDVDAIDAAIAAIDERTDTDAMRIFELGAAGTRAVIHEVYPDAASVVLEDINDDGGSPYFQVIAIQDANGADLWTSEDDEETAEGFSEYAPMLDRDLDRLSKVDAPRGDPLNGTYLLTF